MLACALMWSGDGLAHERSESFSKWRQQDGLVSLRFTVSTREATRIPATGTALEPATMLARYLEPRIQVRDQSGNCQRGRGFRPVKARSGYLQVTAHWRCDGAPDRIIINSFFDLAAEHAHFATLEMPGGATQRLLTSEQRTWDLVTGPAAGRPGTPTFASFLGLGFRHVLSGLDHVLFLMVLLTACRRARELFWAVTGFTLGHSLTLGLAATGSVEPNIPAIEAMIGLTIALVAAERAAHRQDQARVLAISCSGALLLLAFGTRWLGGLQPGLLSALALFVFCYLMLAPGLAEHGVFKVLVTSLFGLVHGLGFATAFLASNLGPGQLLVPLAGFNTGLELGQLAVVGLLGAVSLLLRARPRLATWSANLTGAAGCALGVYWFIQRGFS
jgi:hypothetical protein